MSEAAKFDSHRRLCPDGGCIGVIGDDGRCRVCGRSAGGGPGQSPGQDEPPPAGFVPPALDDEDEDEAEHESADGEERGAAGLAPAAGGFDPNRRLCPDGECLGVLGADGVCNVCGKKAD
jgi:hypothetical protein